MGFLGGLIFGPGIFWAFDFCSHLIIHVTLNREYPLKLAVVKALFALLINKIETTVIKKSKNELNVLNGKKIELGALS